MIRSLYSGISGMKGFQTKLDVIGNNIANVNTHGFKKGRVMFQDMVSQQLQNPIAPTDVRGGVNPQQVGTGSMIGAIDTVHTEGGSQFTGRTLDLMINGDGYFSVDQNGETFYTRAGNFYIDPAGDIVNSSGSYLLDVDGQRMSVPEGALGISIDKEGFVHFTMPEDADEVDPVQIAVSTFSNPDGMNKVGGSLFAQTAASGVAVVNGGGQGAVQSGSLEMSNVDLTDEFTEMIVAQRGFQANSRVITTSDEILQELVNLKR